MEEIFEAEFSDQKILAQLDNLQKQILELEKSVGKVGDTAAESLNQAAGAAGNFEQAMDSAAAQTAQQAKAVTDAQKANQSWLQSIRQTIAGQQIAGKSLGEWSAQAREFATSISSGAKATGTASTAMRVFSTVLKASGIGLLIGLIASVIAYFTRFQSGIDKVSQVMAGLNAVVNVLIDRFLKVGTAIAKVFTGDFAGAARDITSAVTGLGDALVSAATDAAALERRLQALRDVTITQSVEAARARVELEKFRQVVDDGTRSLGARAGAARQASEIERTLAQQAVDRALEAQQIAQAKFALDKESLAAREEAAKAEIEFQEAIGNLNSVNFNAEKEQREFRKQASDERRKALEEEAKKTEALRKEYEKLYNDIAAQAEQLERENIFNPVDRVIADFEAAKGQINVLRERLLEIAPDAAARARVEVEVEKLFDQLLIKYREEYAAAADELEKLKGGKIREALAPLPPADTIDEDLKFRAKSALQSLTIAADEFIAEQEPKSLLDLLGISEGNLEGLKDATAKIVDALGEIADARVKEADAAVDAAKQKVKAAEDALEDEIKLAEKGEASDVSLRERQLAAAKQAQETAEKERQKAVRTQILLDTATQVSGLITSSVNIFKSVSSIPFVGIPLAIGLIAAMFAAFGKAKSDALKAASAPKLRKGGEGRISGDGILMGNTHEGGGIGIEAEHGELVFSDGRRLSVVNRNATDAHFDLLRAVNQNDTPEMVRQLSLLTGQKSDYAATPMAASARSIEQTEQERRGVETGQQYAAMVAAYEKSADKIVTAIKEQPEIYPIPNGYRVRKKRGRNTLTETVKFE